MANTKRCTYDWESVRLDYETGMLTFREMSASHGMAISSIHKYAKTHGWSRVDKSKLHKRVQEKLNDEAMGKQLTANKGTGDSDNVRRIIDPVEVAATIQTNIIQSHRGMIDRARILLNEMLMALDIKHSSGQSLMEIAKVLAMDPKGDNIDKKQLDDYLRQLGLGPDAEVFDKLSRTMERLIKLERQAYGVKEEEGAQQKTYEERLRELMESPYTDETGRVIDVAPVSVEETEKD